ncbi:DUF3108 domain-containing protein [Neomegalonema sp.]|uniref:DUF3108 domain-containing protein n=1 Tax=Neomegalonema sp. TaxID=2039713 RepID=UPI00262C0D16|nr:DUF3108 domain-containing protein [Neomegalonema sp.]MDD2868931.1 DUF3108 domain-containing protein [Neomegalonema sp.]
MWPKRRRAATAFRVWLGVGAVLASAGSAEASEKGAAVVGPGDASLEAVYDFHIGGLSIGEAVLRVQTTPETYAGEARMQPRGMLEMFLSGRAEAQAQGARDGLGAFDPHYYEARFEGKSDAQTLVMTLEGASPVTLTVEPPEKEPNPHAAPWRDQIGVLDPVSAIVASFLPLSAGNVCSRTIPVFDGSRRYDVMFTAPDPKSGAPAPRWSKPLRHCMGVYERIAGFPPETLRDERYYVFDIWFEEGDGPLWRPVRLAGRTRLGYAVGSLRE